MMAGMRLRTALIGCGKVGATHADALAALPASDLVAVCDRTQAGADAFAARYGVAAFTDVATMVREAGVQAVSVCTPHPVHADAIEAAAANGAHVIVEKPLAATLADCDRAIAACEAAGVQLGVISQRRFYPPIVRMKAAIDEGRIGRPALATVDILGWRDAAYYASNPWRGTWAGEGGGVLVNQAPHQLDLLQWLMGPVEELFGYWDNLAHPGIEVDDTAVAVVRFRGGGLATILLSNAQNPGLARTGPRPRLERGVDRDADRLRVDVHLRRHVVRRAAGQRPVDDRRRGRQPRPLAGRGPGVRGGARRDDLVPRAPDRRLPRRRHRGPAARRRRPRGPQGGRAVHRDLPVAAGPSPRLVPARPGDGPRRPRRAARADEGPAADGARRPRVHGRPRARDGRRRPPRPRRGGGHLRQRRPRDGRELGPARPAAGHGPRGGRRRRGRGPLGRGLGRRATRSRSTARSTAGGAPSARPA